MPAFGRGRRSAWHGDELRLDEGRERRGGGGSFHGVDGLRVTGRVFALNGPVKDGGGLYLHRCRRVVVSGCVFVGNFAKWGGGLYLERCEDVVVEHNTFALNAARRDGGAISVSHSARVVLRHNRVLLNVALRSAPAVDVHLSIDVRQV
ncbi:right-handed parallel beta-helix repeat-containing protein [Saccharothrix obliqua]|uniref:right-handed parallel beta-helix repeat-containing protein n=1 Tax=Saccharothrix obliqua TaxID=2861747 RepID=UPI001C5F80E0|nr:right-handed parallel beta-helix repeat-containing protein [Saccharothrix obliqua]MBW4720531.1 right-handed parallel beta-helix repeat-containing protein [Saccharothrix obliqua]